MVKAGNKAVLVVWLGLTLVFGGVACSDAVDSATQAAEGAADAAADRAADAADAAADRAAEAAKDKATEIIEEETSELADGIGSKLSGLVDPSSASVEELTLALKVVGVDDATALAEAIKEAAPFADADALRSALSEVDDATFERIAKVIKVGQ